MSIAVTTLNIIVGFCFQLVEHLLLY